MAAPFRATADDDWLRAAIDEPRDFCLSRDVDLKAIIKLRNFEWTAALKDVAT